MATPDGKKPKEEEEEAVSLFSSFSVRPSVRFRLQRRMLLNALPFILTVLPKSSSVFRMVFRGTYCSCLECAHISPPFSTGELDSLNANVLPVIVLLV